MLLYENTLWNNGINLIAGVDEVGRGCLFGDVLAAAVLLPRDCTIEGIRDSKLLSAKQRESLYEAIMMNAISIGIGRVDPLTIDIINIKEATRLAMKNAIMMLNIQPDHILIDSEKIETTIPFTAIVHGDQLSQSIAAASILAKVTRDRLCEEWDKIYPEYGLIRHKGYSTKLHKERILEYGLSSMHRKTFCRQAGYQLALF